MQRLKIDGLMLMRKIFWFFRRKYRWYLHCIFKNGIDCCNICAGNLEGSWWTSDAIWLAVNGGYAGSYCHRCFNRLCDESGVHLLWVAQVYPEYPAWRDMRELMNTDPHFEFLTWRELESKLGKQGLNSLEEQIDGKLRHIERLQLEIKDLQNELSV